MRVYGSSPLKVAAAYFAGQTLIDAYSPGYPPVSVSGAVQLLELNYMVVH